MDGFKKREAEFFLNTKDIYKRVKIKKIIKEEMNDMWQNLLQGEPNLWLSYQMIIFDEIPTEEKIIKLVKDAFKSGFVKQESINSWEDEGLENEARTIITYDSPYLRINLNDGWLYYGSHVYQVIKNYPELRTIKYSEVKDYLVNESKEMNDMEWMMGPINPWEEYNMIIFDIEPTPEEINNYIELALNTKNPKNKSAWSKGREDDISSILDYVKNSGGALLSIDDWGTLQYCSYEDRNIYSKKYLDNSIKYSELVSGNINESQEDDWDWAKEYTYTFNIKKGDTVVVKNLGNYNSYLQWLGDYAESYEMGEYGDDITGVVQEIRTRSTFVGGTSFVLQVDGDEIMFPLEYYMTELSYEEEYLGLSLGYIVVSNPITEAKEDGFGWARDISLSLPKTKEELWHFVGWSFLYDQNKFLNGEWYHNGKTWKITRIVGDVVYYYNHEDGVNTRYIGTFLEHINSGWYVLVSPEGVIFDPLFNRTYTPKINESEDLKWIQEVEPDLRVKVSDLKEGLRVKINTNKEDYGVFFRNDLRYYMEQSGGGKGTVRYWSKPDENNTWVGVKWDNGDTNTYPLHEDYGIYSLLMVIDEPLTESEEDDWDWTRGPIFTDKVNVGDRIRIHNRGEESAFISWLGMFSDAYLQGRYGKNVEGVVSKVNPEEFVLNISGTTIFFPYEERMKRLSSETDEYDGLDMEYELITDPI